MDSHFGVYGLVIECGHLLVVRKARGPYAKQLDLPGGSPIDGESLAETIKREFLEEVRVDIARLGEWHRKSFFVFKDSANNDVYLEHKAAYCLVDLKQKPNLEVELEDVYGAVWIPLNGIEMRNDISQLVKETLHLVL